MPGLTLANVGFLGSSIQYFGTYVGGYTVSYGSTASSVVIPLNSLSGGLATSPSVGDVVIAVAGNASDNVDHTLSITGYTTIGEYYVNSTRDINLLLSYKILTSTDTQFTVTNNATNAAMGSSFAVHVWRGIDKNNTFDVTTATTSSSNVTPNPPLVTTQTPNAIVIGIGFTAHGQGVETFSSSDLTTGFVTSGGNSTTSESTIGMGAIITTTPGTIDPAAFSFSSSAGTAPLSSAITLALKPGI